MLKWSIRKSDTDVKLHEELKHLGIKYKCDDCDYQASSKKMLKRHEEKKHSGLTFGCNICVFRGNTKKHLKLHTQRTHLGGK